MESIVSEKGVNPITGKYFPFHDFWCRNYSCSAFGRSVRGLVICPEKILHEIDCAIYDTPKRDCTCNAEERAIKRWKDATDQ